MSANEQSLTLDALAAQVSRISPSMSKDPHKFYEARSEVAAQIRRVAEWVRTGRRPPEIDTGD